MKHNQVIPFVFCFFLFSCHTSNKKTDVVVKKDTVPATKPITVKIDTMPFLDTTIVLKHASPSTLIKNNLQLSSKTAEKILYAYFKKQGINEENSDWDTSGPQPTCISFDTIRLVNINDDKFPDAIIDYWLAPCGSSSHCYQPQYGIIISSANKYSFIAEDFLPDDSQIDSIVSKPGGNAIIYGTQLDCPDNNIIRRLKITLNCK